ncbi:MAG: hypothetical protein HYZ27_09525 [Deltaproteobacteria bacterium]|nr:hypothetical protein [Deltaproteobacteria bacterium]
MLFPLVLVMVPGAVVAAPLVQEPQCKNVEVTGAHMECQLDRCLLLGSATLTCGELRLKADELEILLGPEQTFAGGEARGHVTIVDSRTVVVCARVSLDQDRIRGRIFGATVTLARATATREEKATFHGDIERHDQDHLTIHDADFTLCDCGEAPPSWLIKAERIEVTVDERATLSWPQVWLNPFGLGLVPVLPLFPVSVPLSSRAPGMLAPRLKLFGGWPMLDLPVFVPFGDSYDLTLAPGLRSDWGRHRLPPPSTWGAPRLGVRGRYAPWSGTRGEINVQWTHDGRQQAARIYAERADAVAAEIERRRELVNRVEVDVDHQSDFSERLRLVVGARFISDDLIPSDFGVTRADQTTANIPSRAQLLWGIPGITALAAADYLLRITTTAGADHSNVRGAERATPHRGPLAHVRLMPLELAGGMTADAEASVVRDGPWVSDLPATLSLAGAAFGVGLRRPLGGLFLDARAALDGLWIDTHIADPTTQVIARVDAELGLRLFRPGALAHLVTPRLTYRGLPWRDGELPDPSLRGVDERLRRPVTHQLAAGLEQSLWRDRGGSLARLVTLAVDQPWDAAGGHVLPTEVELAARIERTHAALRASFDFREEEPIKEVGATLSAAVGIITLGGYYARWTPEAERMQRTLYELAAAHPGDAPWIHAATLSAGLRLPPRLRLAYASDYLLPIPEPERDTELLEHRVLAAYRSPCNCWEVSATVGLAPKEGVPLSSSLRGGVTLTVADYELGI